MHVGKKCEWITEDHMYPTNNPKCERNVKKDMNYGLFPFPYMYKEALVLLFFRSLLCIV